MRLFVAADISDDTRAELARVRRDLVASLAGAAKPPRVAWVKDEAAHVTLRFIGEVSDAVAGTVQEALALPFGVDAFDVRWNLVGTFPGGNSPRGIWLGASSGVEALGGLAAQVNARLHAQIGPSEERPFNAHLTIGRIKEPGRGIDWRRIVDGIRPPSAVSRVDHVTLYRSTISSKGPTYTALSMTPLRA